MPQSPLSSQTPQPPATEEELRSSFLKIDTDSSGRLNKHKIKVFFEKHGKKNFTDKELDDLIVFADTNCDGVIDVNEFVSVS